MKADPKGVLTGAHYIDGDIAISEGGIAAGCRFFAGYPITPATEVAERAAARLPLVGGMFIQMEDEIASMAAILGASWAGVKSMTSTSGPGISLMMENIGLGVMLETPAVIVNVMRGGPSTGLPTMVGQSDVMQARWGSHGDYEIIALSPDSPQEGFDLMIVAFNLAEKYRTPVIFLTDECVGHMTEKVVIPEAGEIEVLGRKYTKLPPDEYLPYKPGENLVPEMVKAGDGYRFHVTGLTHDYRGYPVMSVECQEELVPRLRKKILDNADDIIIIEEDNIDGADVVVVSYGITSRIARFAQARARKEGLKVGHIRLLTIWPFCEKRIREIAPNIGAFVVVENNLGQMYYEVERCAGGHCKTLLSGHAGGDVHDPHDILDKIKEALK